MDIVDIVSPPSLFLINEGYFFQILKHTSTCINGFMVDAAPPLTETVARAPRSEMSTCPHPYRVPQSSTITAGRSMFLER